MILTVVLEFHSVMLNFNEFKTDFPVVVKIQLLVAVTDCTYFTRPSFFPALLHTFSIVLYLRTIIGLRR